MVLCRGMLAGACEQLLHMTNTKWPHCRMTKCFYGDRCKNAALNTHTCTAGHFWHHLCASQIDNIEDMSKKFQFILLSTNKIISL